MRRWLDLRRRGIKKKFALIAAGALLGALMALSLTACGGSSSRDRISARADRVSFRVRAGRRFVRSAAGRIEGVMCSRSCI